MERFREEVRQICAKCDESAHHMSERAVGHAPRFRDIDGKALAIRFGTVAASVGG